jgi:hypothetical protein
MHSLYEHWLLLFDWLTKQGASRATVCLVFITAWHAFLTYRMSKAMERQTRAQVQPILQIDFTIGAEEVYPKGSFRVKKLGIQPILIRHMRMTCHRDRVEEYDEYPFYERHLITPNDSIGFPFDFTKQFTKRGFTWWSPGGCAFNLWVVASDLGGGVVLTYVGNHYWQTLRVSNGMLWWVRRKFVATYFKQRYYRVLYKFRPPKVKFTA